MGAIGKISVTATAPDLKDGVIAITAALPESK
jgi:hypothetical protein